MNFKIKYIIPGALILLSQSNIALTDEKSNFNGFNVSIGASNTNLESSNNVSNVDLSGNYISSTDYSFNQDNQIINLGLSYTHSISKNFNASYNFEFYPGKIDASFSGDGPATQTDEITNLIRSSLQIGYLINPELELGIKVGFAKADQKNIETTTKELSLDGKSLGIVAKKKIKDNLFLNLEYSQISFDKSPINNPGGLDDNEVDLELFNFSISYKFK